MLWEEVGTTRGCDSSELNDRIFVTRVSMRSALPLLSRFSAFLHSLPRKIVGSLSFIISSQFLCSWAKPINVFRRSLRLQALLQVYNTMLQHCLIYNNQTTTDLESIAVGETMGMFCRSRPEKRLFMQKSILTGHSLSQSFSTDTPFALRATQSSDCEMFIHSAAKWLCRLSYIKLQVLRHV